MNKPYKGHITNGCLAYHKGIAYVVGSIDPDMWIRTSYLVRQYVGNDRRQYIETLNSTYTVEYAKEIDEVQEEVSYGEGPPSTPL
jgi:hypothetical protein